jgi:hypothetical protein
MSFLCFITCFNGLEFGRELLLFRRVDCGNGVLDGSILVSERATVAPHVKFDNSSYVCGWKFSRRFAYCYNDLLNYDGETPNILRK